MRQVYRVAFDFMNMDIPPVLEVYDVLSEYEVLVEIYGCPDCDS